MVGQALGTGAKVAAHGAENVSLTHGAKVEAGCAYGWPSATWPVCRLCVVDAKASTSPGPR